MTQLLDLDLVTADPSNSLPTDGPAGPGRVLIGDVAAAAVTLQNAVDNGATATRGSTADKVEISGSNRSDEPLTVTQTSADPGAPIATFEGDHTNAHVRVSGPSAEGTLSLHGEKVVSSSSQLGLGSDGVERATVDADGVHATTFLAQGGTSAAPAVVVDESSPTTGLYAPSPDSVGISIAGVSAVDVTSTSAEVSVGGNTALVVDSNGMVAYASGTPTFEVTSTDVRPATNQQISAGSESYRFSNVYTGATFVRGSSGLPFETTTVVNSVGPSESKEIVELVTKPGSVALIELTALVGPDDAGGSAVLKIVVRSHNDTALATPTLDTILSSIDGTLDPTITAAAVGDVLTVYANGTTQTTDVYVFSVSYTTSIINL